MDIKKQLEIIKRGAVDIVSEDELVKKLERSAKEGRPLRVKAGFDPTAPDIHLGHTVLLRKLRQFQDLGHDVYFLIGDFTARIGDPTGRSAIRKTLSDKEIAENAKTYRKQAAKVLDVDKLKVVFNSEWFVKMPVADILKLTTHVTVSQMLARQEFRKRLEKNQDVTLMEFMYPVLQGYDSVVLEADIELGGTDQIFNLLVGRDFQKDFSQEQQVVITMPLLEGTDGINKMSKSLGNYIGINEAASDIFGKVMSISDELMLKYYTLLTDEELEAVKGMHPKEAKMKLAGLIASQYHGAQAARQAESEFQRVFSGKEVPSDMPVFRCKVSSGLVDVIVQGGIAKSRNEARRLIAQGGVCFNGQKVASEGFLIEEAGILKVGSRRFLKIELG